MSNHRKFIVWDWNGTLLDDTDAVLDCVNTVLTKLGKNPIDMELFRATQIRPLEQFYIAVGLSAEEAPKALENERTIFHDRYEPLADNSPLRDGAHDLLHDLRRNDVSNIIVSNHITDQIVRLLQQRNIHHHFDEIIAYISRGKQFRDMTKGQKLEHYVADKKLSPGNAIIVGDTMEEIEIARDMGMISVAITGGIQSESRLRSLAPDYVVHSLHELRDVFKERGFVQ